MKIKSIKIDLWDIFLFLNILSFSGAIIYKVYQLNKLGIFLSLLLSILLFLFFEKLKEKESKNNVRSLYAKIFSIFKTENKKINKKYYIIPILYLINFSFLIYLLIKNASDNSLISPWQIIPGSFFFFYFSLSVLLILNIKNLKKSLSLFLIFLHFFLSFLVAILVYKIGYGFDPFIHEATMDIISQKGFVNPKPSYYLGFYSLIIILHKTLFIPIAFLNKYLVAILASIFIPLSVFEFLEEKFNSTETSLLLVLSLLIIPFPFFIMSTPQNLAYLLLFVVIIKSITINSYYKLFFLYILSFTAILIQPIAGIPAFFLVLLLNIAHSELKFKKIFLFISLTLSSTILPLLFYTLEKSSEKSFNFHNLLLNISSPLRNGANNSLSPFIPSSENIILNFIYLYAFNIKLIIFLLFISGFFLYIKNKKECKFFIHFLFMSFSLFISYLLTSSLSFSYLVDYERNNYANRILLISAFFILPFIILSFYNFLNKLAEKRKTIQIPVFTFILILLLSSLYLSYPRLDNFHNSHGISTGIHDIEAVQWIEDNRRWQYAVLANQQVSAAALSLNGFNKYFSNNIFYYPIPTSSPLYQFYLNMVYDEASKKNALKAMDLLNINEIYFVLNKYWWAFPKILDEAKLEADSFVSFGDDDVFVFKYTR